MEPKPKQYLVDAKQLQDIMKYLMTRPYGEVFPIMSEMAKLKPLKRWEKGKHAMKNENSHTKRIRR